MLGNFERLATDPGADGLYGYEEDDDFVVNDDVNPELEADAGGFFVHNPVKTLASHPVEFVSPVVAPLSTGVAAVALNGGSHAAVPGIDAGAMSAAAALVSPHFASVPPLFEAFTAFVAHWNSICAQRGNKGPPSRIPPSLYPFGFDIAYQAKTAHPRHQITGEIVDEIKKSVPLEADSIRAFLKRVFKAGVSAKYGAMGAEAAALEALSLRGSGAVTVRPTTAAPVNVAAAAAASTPPPQSQPAAAVVSAAVSVPAIAAASSSASAPSTAAPQPTVAEIKNAATNKKALTARQAAAASLLATFRQTLDNDIATGKIAEPLPTAPGESENKRRPIVWRPQLRDLLGECVEAELAVAELATMRSQFVDAGTVVPLDDKTRERLRIDSRDSVCRKVLDFWPPGWMTLQKCRAAYQVYQKRAHTPAADLAVSSAGVPPPQQASAASSQAVKSQAVSSQVVVSQLSPPWKPRKRYFCVYSGCSEGFNSIDPLKNHIIAAHHDGDATATLQLPQRAELLIGDFKCAEPNCYETFFAIQALNMHMTKSHPGRGPVVVPMPTPTPAPTTTAPASKKRAAPDSVSATTERATQERPVKQGRKKVLEASKSPQASSANGSADELVAVDEDEPAPVFRCALCMKPAQYECTGCSAVHYCSQQCQTASWKAHMLECKELAKTKKEPQ